MTFEEFLKSKTFKTATFIASCVIILVAVFGAGVFVGLEKAKFSYRWDQNYVRIFGGPTSIPQDKFFLNAHGVDGQIIKIDSNTITIKGRDGVEKNIVVGNDTFIKKDRSDIQLNNLQDNDFIVVVGSPNDQGEINGKLIRVMPGFPNIPINQ